MTKILSLVTNIVVMDALENVLVGEVLALHCHENGDCQGPDDRHSERSRVWSELFNQMVANQNAYAFGPSSTVARMKMKTKSKSFGCCHDGPLHRGSKGV